MAVRKSTLQFIFNRTKEHVEENKDLYLVGAVVLASFATLFTRRRASNGVQLILDPRTASVHIYNNA